MQLSVGFSTPSPNNEVKCCISMIRLYQLCHFTVHQRCIYVLIEPVEDLLYRAVVAGMRLEHIFRIGNTEDKLRDALPNSGSGYDLWFAEYPRWVIPVLPYSWVH